MNQPLINNPSNPILRSVITGAIASAVASSTINMRKVKNQEISKKEALRDTFKRTSQGAIATGAAVATADYLSQKGGFIKAMTTISVGMAGIYALEVLDDKLNKCDEKECCEDVTLIAKEQ
ncbi:hypothetical protein CRV01_08870 [Arcobacter sp. CECT 8983]|uniref:hypothetical protein n=1 Tax=Arcobacter sp. CECT 8983 TaxID=2044508 RepID=UPI00100AB689|nr:hypothetical protein [Arcobacter sp. CECT 8983]RXJ88729.1 hypothetical protein CRV01_08870 [Arcobacter sp. CECT 8983]